MRINNFQKFISGLLIGLILYPQLSLIGINAVQAQVLGTGVTPTHEVSTTNPITYIRTTFNSISATMSQHRWVTYIIDKAKKIAYNAFKAAILDRLVMALIAWINNDGKGSIVNNWDEFFEDAKNIAGGEFARGLSGGMLCSPFNLQVQLTLMPVNRFDSVSCTLNQVIGNIDSFMGDFRNGSWLAYQEVWYPRNNFYGATIIGLDELAKAQYAGLEAKKGEAQAGQGFLSFSDCKMVVDPNGHYTKEGDDINATLAGGVERFRREFPGQAIYRKECRVATPGLVAAEAATQVLVKTPLARIMNNDDITGYLTAIFNAATNRLTIAATKGIAGLLADATRDTKINPVFPCAGLTGDTFLACMNSVNAEKAEVNSFTNGTNALGATTLDTRHQISDNLSQAIALQTSYVNSLTDLAACQSQTSTPEITEEEDLLVTLQDKFESNQSFLDALADSQTTSAASVSVTPAELAQAAQLAAAAVASANNISDAQFALTDSQTQLNDIQAKVADRLPGIQIQLDACPKLQLILPTQ